MTNITIHQAFFEQAAESPDATCLVDGEITLSYRCVEKMVINMHHVLQQKGVKKGSVVSLYCDKRFQIVIAFLAISSLGARCVQLDKAFPRALLRDIIIETNTMLLLCDNPFESYEDLSLATFNIVDNYCNLLCSESLIQSYVVDQNDPIWLVYSSGTTGKHKGISISHRAILSSYQTRYKVKDYNSRSRVGCNIYYLWEVFRPILNGGASYIIQDDILHDFSGLADYLIAHDIDECLFTPSYLETLLHHAIDEAKRIFAQLRTCWLNGEVVSIALYHKLRPFLTHTEVYNLYSISECHDVAVYRLGMEDENLAQEGVLPVGFLLDDVDVVLLNEKGQLCQEGEKGELYVHSVGLADGYINRPALNKERFIAADKSSIGKRLYKTGDHAFLSNDNKLITIYGRCDYLVKLRGYTVSLPFVEAVIKDKLNIAHCIVSKVSNDLLNEHLVAHIEVAKDEQQAFCEKWQLNQGSGFSQVIMTHLAEFLAPYMRPQAYMLMENIQINAYSNKIDRLSVVDNDPRQITRIDSIEDYKKLWAELLKLPVQVIGESSCFFKLGGTSLSAIALLTRTAQSGLGKLKISQFVNHSSLKESFERMSQASEHSLVSNALQRLIEADIECCHQELCSYFKVTQVGESKLVTQSNHWLVTGATGFLGAELLYQLLITTQDRVTCLVRGDSDQAAYMRILSILKKFQVVQSDINQRVSVVAGDVAINQFGLSDKVWRQLCQQITGVVNAAANVNLILPYEAVKPTCLNGVSNVIKFALSESKKPLYHISTNGIFSSNSKNVHERTPESESCAGQGSGYGQAKWAAEKLITLAQKEFGLEVNIFRPGNLSSVRSNHVNVNDMNTIIIEEIIKQQKVPKGLRLEMTPVDHVCNIIITSMRSTKLNQIYSMTNIYSLTDVDLASYINFPIINKNDWLERNADHRLRCLIDGDEHALSVEYVKYEQGNYEWIMRQLSGFYPQVGAMLKQLT